MKANIKQHDDGLHTFFMVTEEGPEGLRAITHNQEDADLIANARDTAEKAIKQGHTIETLRTALWQIERSLTLTGEPTSATLAKECYCLDVVRSAIERTKR